MARGTRTRLDEETERRGLRRLLQAAAADERDGVPVSPFFAARVAARVAASPPATADLTLGAAAWRLLPALAALVLAVTAWTGYETARLHAAQETTLAAAMGGEGGGADALIAMLMLGGEAPAAGGSGR